jgi:hypothetical protein
MCVFFPLVLALMAAVWALPVALPVAVAWDAALLVGLGVLVARMRRPVNTLQGVPVGALTGRGCPACGSCRTTPWMSGRTPLGLHCQACDRRTPGPGRAP